jgi:hypothetical protein
VASPSPPPMPPNDVQDLLVIADMVDTLDHVPAEVTRVHSDLNELSAVLYCKLSQKCLGREADHLSDAGHAREQAKHACHLDSG